MKLKFSYFYFMLSKNVGSIPFFKPVDVNLFFLLFIKKKLHLIFPPAKICNLPSGAVEVD